ncbi:MAG TPA: tetratricopeptide repeat protein [Geobacteraceae bacterium]
MRRTIFWRLLRFIVPAGALLCSACAFNESARKQGSYHYQMGVAYFNEKNMAAALTELTEAEKYDDENPELYNYLGMAYFVKKKFDIAEQKYLRALALKQNFSEVRNNLGVDYLEMRRWDEAIFQFKLVTEDIFYPNQAAANINLGLAYFGKGDYLKALSNFHSVVANYPRDPRGRLNLGRVYFALDKLDLAIEEYRKAIELNRDYANAYYNLGMVYLKTKDNHAAMTAFQEVLRIAPDSEIGQLSREYLDTLK